MTSTSSDSSPDPHSQNDNDNCCVRKSAVTASAEISPSARTGLAAHFESLTFLARNMTLFPVSHDIPDEVRQPRHRFPVLFKNRQEFRISPRICCLGGSIPDLHMRRCEATLNEPRTPRRRTGTCLSRQALEHGRRERGIRRVGAPAADPLKKLRSGALVQMLGEESLCGGDPFRLPTAQIRMPTRVVTQAALARSSQKSSPLSGPDSVRQAPMVVPEQSGSRSHCDGLLRRPRRECRPGAIC